MHALLKTYFGYDRFLPLQEEIISNVLAGNNSLVLMPTGGGKSLCYQLPALKLDGLALVVSPLIALMKDQVDALRANGLPAAFINSTLSSAEIDRVQKEAQGGRLKLLYLAPERIAAPSFRDFLRTLKMSLIAIDEAHCISEWGHDFRPAYRNLKILRAEFPQAPLIALTATATQQVRADIIAQLDLEGAKIFSISFDRPNLTYLIRPKKGAFDHLVALLKKHENESTIIYCFARKDTENITADLRAEGFRALPYHAGLENDVRRETQEKFIRDEVPIVVATIAFGMGINKPDIRLIAHMSLPKTLEGYYQETGRAGRDGLPAECVLFYSPGDRVKQEYFIGQVADEAERKNAREKLAAAVDFCELPTCRRRILLGYFGEELKPRTASSNPASAGTDETFNCGGCDICLAVKEEFDATEITQKILSVVLRTGERFGLNYVLDVLRGASRAKIRERGHHQLSVFAIADDFNADELQQIARHLLVRGLLAKNPGDYPTLRVTPAGRNFLRQREKITLQKPQADTEVRAVKVETADFDKSLFEKLRTLRKAIADEKGVSAFIIFTDASLRQMAHYLPSDDDNFVRITGVSDKKLAQFGARFLEVIKAHVHEHGLDPRTVPGRNRKKERAVKRTGSTYDETRHLVAQKLPLAAIAEQRGVTVTTIITHLEKLAGEGVNMDIEYLKPAAEKLARIKAAFQKSTGGATLKPVHKILGGKLSYAELRLARIFLEGES